MANEIFGRNQFAEYQIGSGSLTPFSAVITGGDITDGYEASVDKGINDQQRPKVGLVDLGGSVSGILSSETCTFLETCVIPAAGVLTPFTANWGTGHRTGKHTSSLVDTASISATAGNNSVEYEVSWFGGAKTTATTPAASPTSTRNYNAHDVSITLGGSNADAQSFNLSLQNNIERIADLNAKVSGSIRSYRSVLNGDFDFTLDMDFIVSPGYDVYEDCVEIAEGVVIVIADACTVGGDTLTITLSDLMINGQISDGLQGDGGLVLYSVQFVPAQKAEDCITMVVTS